MATVEPMEIGLMFWAEETAEGTLAKLIRYGLRNGQLGLPPTADLKAALLDWKRVLPGSDVVLTAAVCSYAGEDYSDLEHVHESVGFTTAKYRGERVARTKEIAAFASEFGIDAVSCHIGFIPEDPADMLYGDLIAVTREICDTCAAYGQRFVLETGQETAAVLLGFICYVDRANLKVNFDPANMVMYGSGDPVGALQLLREHVLSVHCKDGGGPSAPRNLGSECRLGDGDVNFPSFLAQLVRMGYTGPLTIEREEVDEAVKTADVYTAIERLKVWKAEAGIHGGSLTR